MSNIMYDTKGRIHEIGPDADVNKLKELGWSSEAKAPTNNAAKQSQQNYVQQNYNDHISTGSRDNQGNTFYEMRDDKGNGATVNQNYVLQRLAQGYTMGNAPVPMTTFYDPNGKGFTKTYDTHYLRNQYADKGYLQDKTGNTEHLINQAISGKLTPETLAHELAKLHQSNQEKANAPKKVEAPSVALLSATNNSTNTGTNPNTTWQDLLKLYATDKKAAENEVVRAKEVYEKEKAAYGAGFDTTDRAKQISNWATQVRGAAGLDDKTYGANASLNQAKPSANSVNATTVKAPDTVLSANSNVKEITQTDQLIEALLSQINSGKSQNDIYNQIMAFMPYNTNQQSLSYDQALKMAGDRLGSQYDKNLEKTLDAVDKNALSRGFFGQLPTAGLQRATAADIEGNKQQAINELAQALMADSKAEADRKSQLNMQEQQARLNTVLAALQQSSTMDQRNIDNMLKLYGIQTDEKRYQDSRGDINWEKEFKERGYVDSRGDVDWEKAFKSIQYGDSRNDIEWEKNFKTNQYLDQKALSEAQLTGYFKNEPTMALTKLAHDMKMDEKQAALTEKNINASISQGWARINQAAEEFNFAKKQAEKVKVPSQEELMKAVKEKAYDMTLDYFKVNDTMGGFTQDEFENFYTQNVNRILGTGANVEADFNKFLKDQFNLPGTMNLYGPLKK